MKHIQALFILLFSIATTFAQSITPSQSAICSGSQMYILIDLPSSATTVWSITNNYGVAGISNMTNNTVDVDKISSGSGIETLTATITHSGGVMVLNKAISFGIPENTFNIFCYLPLNPPCYGISSFYVFRFWGIEPLAYEWSYRETGTTSETPALSSSDHGVFFFSSPGSYDILARPVNACGTGNASIITIEVIDFCDSDFRLSASPAPANAVLNVVIDKISKEVQAIKASEKVQFHLLELNKGNLVKQWTFDNTVNKRMLNVSDVKAGNYILVAYVGKYKKSTQVVIRK